MALKQCPNCKAKLDPEFLFCPECGASVPAAPPQPEVVPPEPAWAKEAVPDPTTLEAVRKSQPRKEEPLVGTPVAQSQSRFKLTRLARGGGQALEYAIPERGIVIGRSGTDISFPDDSTLSSRHAMVKVVGESVEVEDLGSLNGIYVRIKSECPLSEGDMFVLGDSVFSVSLRPSSFDATEYRLYAAPSEKPVIATVARILQDGREGEVFAVRSLPFLFGREEGDVRCGSDKFMSRKHAAIQNSPKGLALVDLKSRNGTYIRRRGVIKLNEGDVFMVGRQLFRVEAVR